MYLLTAEEMRSCDARTIASHVPGRVLMERAGMGIFREIRRRFDRLNRRRVVIVCGRGNNGGDGLVLARLLHDAGYNPRVLLTDPAGQITGDAESQIAPVRARGIPIERLREDRFPEFASLEPEDLLVDAIFGTGLKGGLSGRAAQIVEAMNDSRATVVAVDIPSGLLADSGVVPGPAVRAHLTVTMAAPKRSFLFWPARDHVVEWAVADIGIPEEVYEAVRPQARLLVANDVAAHLRPFPRDAHKGIRGKVLIVGGSPGLTGAPSLAALGAAHAGAGLVRVALPHSLNPILEAKLTEPMTFPVEETDRATLSLRSLDFLLGLSREWDAMVLGPGLGRHPESDRLVAELFARWTGPIVIDADALNALAATGIPRHPEARAHTVLTPHPGEMARLAGTSIAAIQADPIAAARSFAESHRVTLVLKGAPTVVAPPQGPALVNTTGNPGLATGGSGDVLSGLVGALLAQGLDSAWAAACAVFLHGLSADLILPRRTERAMAPNDVIEGLPEAWTLLAEMPTDAG